MSDSTSNVSNDQIQEKSPNLKVNFVFNLISQILTLVIPLITTPYLARVLHEEGNGQISFATSIITYFVLLSNFGFNIYGQREIARFRNDKEKKSCVFWEITIIKSFLTIISLGVLFGLCFGNAFADKYTNLIMIMSIQVGAVVFDITFFYQGEENFKTLALRQIVLKLIGLILIFVFVKTESDTWIYALCLSLSTIFASLTLWISLFKKISFIHPNKLKFKHHIYPSFMIFLPTVAITIYSVFDKTMIGLLAKNPDYENGCYEQAYKLNGVILLIVTVISPILMPRNSHDYSSGNLVSLDRHLKFAINYVWMFGIPLIFGISSLAWNLSSWFLGSGYAEVPLLLCIMSVRFVVSGFSEIFGSQLFIAIGKEKYVSIATFIVAITNLILNYFFIPLWGATGAAIATAICEVICCLIEGVLAVKSGFISAKYLFLKSWKYLVSGLVMFAVIYTMQHFMTNEIWTFLVITLVGVIVYSLMLLLLRETFFTDIIKKGINIIKNKLHKQGAK